MGSFAERAALIALIAGSLSATTALPPAFAAEPAVVDAGALRATVDADPGTSASTGPSAAGVARGARRHRDGPGRHARLPYRGRLVSRHAGDRAHARRRRVPRDAADERPGGARSTCASRPPQTACVAVDASVQGAAAADVLGTGISFVAPPGERHLGFGERSNAVDQRGLEVENYVAEGPYQQIERPFISAFVPPAGYHPRDDATYFPIPWLLSTRGIGVLVTNDETSVFRLATDQPDAWSVEAAAPRLGLRVVAGPQPAAVLRRFSALVGRQPPVEAPFFLGPWWQPKGDDAGNIATLKAAGAIGSVVQTYTHYLPCGDQDEAGRARADRALPRRGARRHHLLQPDGVHAVHARLRGGAAARRADAQRARRAVRVPLHGRVPVLRRPGRLHPSRRLRLLRRPARRGGRPRLRRLDGGLRRVHAARRARLRRIDRRGVPQQVRGRVSRRGARVRPRPRASAARALQPLRLDGRRAPQPDRLGRRSDARAGGSTASSPR